MKTNYDILVIGGGPAGALAAKTAAEAGNSVCLIEKRPAIGTPVRCAEGIGKELLKEFIRPDPRWISADIESARIIAPNGTAIKLDQARAGNEVGYVLDRKVFDRELVWQAAEAGADVIVKTREGTLVRESGRYPGRGGHRRRRHGGPVRPPGRARHHRPSPGDDELRPVRDDGHRDQPGLDGLLPG